MKKWIKYFWFAVGLAVIWMGITEFDNATYWIPLFRGLFWMGVGSVVMWTLPERGE